MNNVINSIDAILPYAQLSKQHEELRSSKPMDDWKLGEAEFRDFFEDHMKLFRDLFWPEYDHTNRRWWGLSRDTALESTKLEIEITLEEFQSSNSMSEKRCDTFTSNDTLASLDERWHYRVEDGFHDVSEPVLSAASGGSGANIVCYSDSIDAKEFSANFSAATKKKAVGLFDFKPRLRRPRPYQMATWLGYDEFKYEVASTHNHKGFHPSFISGHCVLGILRGCAIFELWLNKGDVANADFDALSNYMVDYGDRRVLGGVHYPSDSIGSWILALNLIDRIYEHKNTTKDFASRAIRSGRVYDVIKRRFAEHEGLGTQFALLQTTMSPSQQEQGSFV
ncbi:MAG: hypothetical protein AAFQ58_22410 [Pseudomonadota bacterium]